MDTTTPTQSSPKTADQQYADDHNYLNYREVVPGWTDDPRALEGLFRHGSGEWYQARYYGIIDPTLVLFGTNNSGEMGFIITSKGRYYIGHLLIDDIFEITNPKKWSTILRVMTEKGDEALRIKKLKHVELPDDEDLPVLREPKGGKFICSSEPDYSGTTRKKE